jgi:hypothetical protein
MPSNSRLPTTGGRIATIVLCVLLALYCADLAVTALFIGFVSDSGRPLNTTELTIAIFLGLIGSPAVGIVAIVVAIIRVVRRRAFTWVIPLAGAAGAAIVFYLAATIGYAAAGMNFWNQ